jgi:hypothetical protein
MGSPPETDGSRVGLPATGDRGGVRGRSVHALGGIALRHSFAIAIFVVDYRRRPRHFPSDAW